METTGVMESGEVENGAPEDVAVIVDESEGPEGNNDLATTASNATIVDGSGSNGNATASHGSAPSARICQDGGEAQLASNKKSFRTPKNEDFDNPEAFLAMQKTQRAENLKNSGGHKVLMLSHCWRNHKTQNNKRRLISALSLNGWSYWGDFLDLQATGPVPWRKEIEDGIHEAAKVVMFLDKAYLLSFNCLQEVAFAQAFQKPIVVIIMEQDAMELLTRPHGADEAWPSLEPFAGKELTPGIGDGAPLTRGRLAKLYETVSNVNFCMCRGMDFENDTEPVVLRRMYDFVSAELAYQKEHALLQTKALEWEVSGRDRSRLLNKAAVQEYTLWINKARQASQQPLPTELQDTYVLQSRLAARRSRRIIQGLTALAFAVVLGLAIVAGVMWALSEENRQRADKEAAFALEQQNEAVRQAEFAREQEQEAVVQARLAQANLLLAENQTRRAEAEKLNAQAQTLIAEEQTALAENKTRLAENSLRIAEQERARAEAEAERANQQTELAVEQALAARARHLLFAASTDDNLNGFPQAAMRLALNATAQHPLTYQADFYAEAAAMAASIRARSAVAYPTRKVQSSTAPPSRRDVETGLHFCGDWVSPDRRFAACGMLHGAQREGNMLVQDLVSGDLYNLKSLHLPFESDLALSVAEVFDVSWQGPGSREFIVTVNSGERATVWDFPVTRSISMFRVQIPEQILNGAELEKELIAEVNPTLLDLFWSSWRFWSSYGEQLVVAMGNTVVVRLDINTGEEQEVHRIATPCTNTCRQWCDGKLLVQRPAYSGDIKAMVWDIRDGWNTHQNASVQIDFDGTTLREVVFGGQASELALVDWNDVVWVASGLNFSHRDVHHAEEVGRPVCEPTCAEEMISTVYSAAWSPDGSRIAVCKTSAQDCKVYNVRRAALEATLRVSDSQETMVAGVRWHGDSRQLVFFLLPPEGGQQPGILQAVVEEAGTGLVLQPTRQGLASMSVQGVRWSHSGRDLLSMVVECPLAGWPCDSVMHFWNAETGSRREVLVGQWGPMASWNDDGSLVAACDLRNRGFVGCAVIAVADGSEQRLDYGGADLCQSGDATHVEFSHDGANIAWMCSTTPEGFGSFEVKVGLWSWPANTLREFSAFAGQEFWMSTSGSSSQAQPYLSWSHDDQYLALTLNEDLGSTATRAVVAVVRVSDGNVAYHRKRVQMVLNAGMPLEQPAHVAAFAPDRHTLAVAIVDSVGLLEVEGDFMLSYRQIGTDPSGRLFAVAWSPDGRRLFTFSGAGSVREWDLTSSAACDVSWPLDTQLVLPGFDVSVPVSVSPRSVSRADGQQAGGIAIVQDLTVRVLDDTQALMAKIDRQGALIQTTEVEEYYDITATAACATEARRGSMLPLLQQPAARKRGYSFGPRGSRQHGDESQSSEVVQIVETESGSDAGLRGFAHPHSHELTAPKVAPA